MGRTWVLVAALALASRVDAGSGARITIWASSPTLPTGFGGTTYGGSTPPSGAMITDQRDVEISPAGGEVRVTGVAATVDPASVQLRGVSDPGGFTISEQRFVPGATTPDEILARHVGDAITVVTTKGEVAGVLRSIDAQALVVEVGSGDQRRLQVMRRDGYVQDVRLPAGASIDKPALVWRLAAKKPGKQTVEVTYRADGMSWSADYLAVLDETAKTIDFSAWATVRNATGAAFDNAELTLVSGGPGAVATPANPYVVTPPHTPAQATRFVVPAAVRLGSGESVQVELMPPRTNAKAHPVIAFEAMPDPSASFQAYPGTDCNQLATAVGTGRAEVAIEVDVPSATPLPDGRVRLFKRKADRLEAVSEDALRTSAGIARIRLSPDTDVVGERHATSCTNDERTHTIREKIELKLENKGKQAVEVVAREFMWRWAMWRIDPADESQHGTRAGNQTQEYRTSLPAGGKKTISYTVLYQW